MGKSIKKITRHASQIGKKAEFTQVSYLNFDEGAPVMWGKKRYRESTPKQKRLNEKKAKRYFEALVEANFELEKDLHITLTFSNEDYPASKEEALKRVKNWIGRLNYRRKKKGMEKCKYVIVFEVSKKGRMHFHVLMDGALDRDTVENCWKQGRANADRLRDNNGDGLTSIIMYLSKGEMDEQTGKRWISSNGLVKPWVSCADARISKKRFNLMTELPEDSEAMTAIIEKDNPGYKLLSVERTFNEQTGQFFFFCRMRLDKSRVIHKVKHRCE